MYKKEIQILMTNSFFFCYQALRLACNSINTYVVTDVCKPAAEWLQDVCMIDNHYHINTINQKAGHHKYLTRSSRQTYNKIIFFGTVNIYSTACRKLKLLWTNLACYIKSQVWIKPMKARRRRDWWYNLGFGRCRITTLYWKLLSITVLATSHNNWKQWPISLYARLMDISNQEWWV